LGLIHVTQSALLQIASLLEKLVVISYIFVWEVVWRICGRFNVHRFLLLPHYSLLVAVVSLQAKLALSSWVLVVLLHTYPSTFIYCGNVYGILISYEIGCRSN
jgi:hypothetical protein